MNAGVLKYVSATEVSYKPFLGGEVKHNGALVEIPATGFPGGEPTLSADTHYYVALETVSSVPTLTFHEKVEGVSHATSGLTGNVGTEILVIDDVPDDTKTLLGMVYTNDAGEFDPRWVRSWFNDSGLSLKAIVDNSGDADNHVHLPCDGTFREVVTVADSAPSKSLRLYPLTWADEVTESLVTGEWHGDAPGVSIEYGICVDGDEPIDGNRMQAYKDGNTSPSTLTKTLQAGHAGHRVERLTEGLHEITVKARGEAGTWGSSEDSFVAMGGGTLYATRHNLSTRRFVNGFAVAPPPEEEEEEPPPGEAATYAEALANLELDANLKAEGQSPSIPLTLTAAAWMNNLHKDGAALTLFMKTKPQASRSGNVALLGNRGGGGSETGVYLCLQSTGQILWGALNNGTSVAYNLTDSGLTLNVDHHLVVSIDEAGNGFIGADGVYMQVGSSNEWSAAYTSPSTGNASQTLQVGALGSSLMQLLSGDVLYDFAILEGVALSKAQTDDVLAELA